MTYLICRLQRRTRQFFGEKVEFNKAVNDEFEKQLKDIDHHFVELEREDDKLNVNEPDVATTIIKGISHEFEKFNSDLRKKDKNSLDITGLSTTQKLERTISGNSLNQSQIKPQNEHFAANAIAEKIFYNKAELNFLALPKQSK